MSAVIPLEKRGRGPAEHTHGRAHRGQKAHFQTWATLRDRLVGSVAFCMILPLLTRPVGYRCLSGAKEIVNFTY